MAPKSHVTPPSKRPITAKTLRALLMTCTPSERITFGKVVIEALIDQRDGVYDLIRILVLNLSDEETSHVNSQIRRVKELFIDTSPGATKAKLSPPVQRSTEGEGIEYRDDREDVRRLATPEPTSEGKDVP